MNSSNEAKEFFEECRRIEQRINGMVSQVQRLRDLALNITASYSDAPRGGRGAQSRVEEAMTKVVALENEINAEIDEMVARRQKAQWLLENLSDAAYRDVLTWRYFSLWSWDRITAAFGYTDRTRAWRLHGRALMEASLLLARAETNMKIHPVFDESVAKQDSGHDFSMLR